MFHALLLIHFAATAYMTGLIWFVQVVHYPLFAAVGEENFVPYEARHTRLTTLVVLPPMLVELVAASWLAWTLRADPTGPLAVIGLTLVGAIWLSTFLVQVPCHDRLTRGFDAPTHRRLVRSNTFRTAAWSIRCVIAGLLIHPHLTT